jgi:hypothetical protein
VSRVPANLRRRVRRRARGLCEYCRSSAELTGHDFTVDHILPEARGGGNDPANLCLCCFWCNAFKQARTEAVDPRTAQRVALFHPRRDRWVDHFRWNRDATRILGRTRTGRATVQALRLNRPALVRARRVWVRHQLHPPDGDV